VEAGIERLMVRALTLSLCLFTMLKELVGQVSPSNLILTKATNDAWISRLELFCQLMLSRPN
jgi:hypothetical protein